MSKICCLTKKVVMFSVVVFAALNIKTVPYSNRSYDLNTTTITAISGEDDPIDGGEIGGVEIKCSTGGSGDCYQKRVETIDLHRCHAFCKATGNPKDYCNSFGMGVIDF